MEKDHPERVEFAEILSLWIAKLGTNETALSRLSEDLHTEGRLSGVLHPSQINNAVHSLSGGAATLAIAHRFAVALGLSGLREFYSGVRPEEIESQFPKHFELLRRILLTGDAEAIEDARKALGHAARDAEDRRRKKERDMRRLVRPPPKQAKPRRA